MINDLNDSKHYVLPPDHLQFSNAVKALATVVEATERLHAAQEHYAKAVLRAILDGCRYNGVAAAADISEHVLHIWNLGDVTDVDLAAVQTLRAGMRTNADSDA